MRTMQKTAFSNLPALDLATIDELIKIQSHDNTVGYFMSPDVRKALLFSLTTLYHDLIRLPDITGDSSCVKLLHHIRNQVDPPDDQGEGVG